MDELKELARQLGLSSQQHEAAMRTMQQNNATLRQSLAVQTQSLQEILHRLDIMDRRMEKNQNGHEQRLSFLGVDRSSGNGDNTTFVDIQASLEERLYGVENVPSLTDSNKASIEGYVKHVEATNAKCSTKCSNQNGSTTVKEVAQSNEAGMGGFKRISELTMLQGREGNESRKHEYVEGSSSASASVVIKRVPQRKGAMTDNCPLPSFETTRSPILDIGTIVPSQADGDRSSVVRLYGKEAKSVGKVKGSVIVRWLYIHNHEDNCSGNVVGERWKGHTRLEHPEKQGYEAKQLEEMLEVGKSAHEGMEFKREAGVVRQSCINNILKGGQDVQSVDVGKEPSGLGRVWWNYSVVLNTANELVRMLQISDCILYSFATHLGTWWGLFQATYLIPRHSTIWPRGQG